MGEDWQARALMSEARESELWSRLRVEADEHHELELRHEQLCNGIIRLAKMCHVNVGQLPAEILIQIAARFGELEQRLAVEAKGAA